MIKYLQYIISNTNDPYINLSLEKYLLDTVAKDTLILYLWKNAPSVFAGPAPDAFRGYSISGLMEDGIMPVRRLSGGKAKEMDENVMHYTFLSHTKDFEQEQQQSVIVNTALELGLSGSKTQEGDFITTDTYQNGSRILHHGFLRVTLNTDHPDLTGADGRLTEELLLNTILDVYDREYGMKAESYPIETVDFSVLRSYEKLFDNEEWIYNGAK